MNWGRALLTIGSLQFLISMAAAERLYPGYDPLRNYISDLGSLNAPTSTLFNTSVFLLGLLGLLSAYLLRREIGRISAVLLALASIGAMGVGVFPEDYGAPHWISALIAFLFGAIAVMAMGARRGGFFKAFGLAAGVISLTALALFIPRVHTPLGIGGLERLVAYPILVFFVVYGVARREAS